MHLWKNKHTITDKVGNMKTGSIRERSLKMGRMKIGEVLAAIVLGKCVTCVRMMAKEACI